MSDSEFGDVLGEIHGGYVISSEGNPERKDGTVIWISEAFNPKTSAQLREIADYMDRLDPENPLSHPECRWNWRTDADGIQWVCKGDHERSEGCEWEIASADLVDNNQWKSN